MTHLPNQPKRLLLLISYVFLLFLLSAAATGHWLPPFSHGGIWFYSGLFAFLMGSLLEAPTHTTPAQAFSFSSLALIAVLGFATSAPTALDIPTRAVLIFSCSYLTAVWLAAAIGIFSKDADKESTLGRLGQVAYVVASFFGRPRWVSFAPFIYGLVGYNRNSIREVLVLTLGWSILVLARPLERAIEVIDRVRSVWAGRGQAHHLGEVVGHGVPGLITIRHDGSAVVEPGSALVVPGDDGRPNVAIALNYIGQADGLWLRAHQLPSPEHIRKRLSAGLVAGGSCARLDPGDLLTELEQAGLEALKHRNRLLGIVGPDTRKNILHFEIVRNDLELQEGYLLEVEIRGLPVLYQLLDGVTREDVLQQKNTRGFVIGKARKIGYWNSDKGDFEPINWLPEPNAPVFLAGQGGPDLTGNQVGCFPGTTYPIEVSESDLVTHNTAILGILGVGKSFLALELVERMILGGVRVICLDLTSQYQQELAPYVDDEGQRKTTEFLKRACRGGKEKICKNVEEGGSVPRFEKAMKRLLARFLNPEKEHKLCIINPSAFEVWRQDSKPYQGAASMVSLTAAEVTRVVSEAAMEACQELGMTDSARCCLVYEEAHSLVPEFTAIAYEGDKAAANGTARAILQGRKFGLGCLLVTQRTASVSKTVLNQCNTVFAMRIFDATGMGFLSNYIGDDYADALSGLRDRHAVVFGKASSSADPVLIRVNDRATFLEYARSESGDEH